MAKLSIADIATQSLIDQFSQAVGPLVAEGEDFALLDFPDHFNVGDSAIYAGQMVFFDQHVKRTPSYVCSIQSYRNDIKKFCPEGPIFMHGGGNFGDIWPIHQAFRHEILARYPDRRIIQLGQSIHFREQSGWDDMARSIDKHGNYTLLVRDHKSFDLASKHFNCQVTMCPDAAHNMRGLKAQTATHDVLSMMRNDPERRKDALRPYLETLGPIKDWERQFWARSPADRIIEKALAPRMSSSIWLMKRREQMFRRQVWNRINYGVHLLSEGELLISDRLHAHILASLMHKPHIALDNSYQKIQRYIAAWGDDGMVTQVSSLDELKEAVEARRYHHRQH